MYTHASLRVQVDVSVFVHVCLNVCLSVFVHMYVYMCLCCVHTCVPLHVHLYACVCVFTCEHACGQCREPACSASLLKRRWASAPHLIMHLSMNLSEWTVEVAKSGEGWIGGWVKSEEEEQNQRNPSEPRVEGKASYPVVGITLRLLHHRQGR